ncbi:MAG: hypothetical protein NZ853_08735 [Leptospiraceae bacterium]|nr:hypothetical protein [Leptospiraceae bacterium]MDW7976739.1 hypothetical protein [Leptospiraceae bacterium]
MDKKSNPQKEYIYIRSIEDIDPKKLSIRDLNKKFIDAHGRKYAVKFDFNTREVQFVRLASSYYEAMKVREEILKNKSMEDSLIDDIQIDDSFSQSHQTESSKVENFMQEVNHEFENKDDTTLVIENEFYKELERESKKAIESLKAVEKILERSSVIQRISTLMSSFINLQKEIEIKVFNKNDDAIKILKELLYYPKNLEDYLLRLPERVRKKIESIPQEERMNYYKRFEIYRHFREMFMNLLESSKKFEDLYYRIPAFEREHKPLRDIPPSLMEISDNTKKILEKMNQWYVQYQKY